MKLRLAKLITAGIALLASLSLHAAIVPTPLPFILQNGQTADATQVMSDFNTIVTNVNANAAPLATSAQTNTANTFTQPQTVPNATLAGHAVNAGQVQQNTIKYFADTGAVNAYIVTPLPAWGSYVGGSDIFVTIANTNTAASTINVNGLGNKNIFNEDGSTPEANALQATRVYHLIYDGTQFLIIGKNNTAVTQAAADNSTKIATTAWVYTQVPAGTVLDFAGTAVPAGFLATDGSAVSRATYATLFTAIGTTWGVGDGSTTFNVPNFNGRVTVADGTALVTETDATSVASNAQVVVSNNFKWITGQTVRVSTSGGLPTGLSGATDYFLIRVDNTHVSFATTLANAQNNTVITITGGSGNITITTSGATAASYLAHTVGEGGGEEKHAMSITELVSHAHVEQGAGVAGGGAHIQAGNPLQTVQNFDSTLSTGGNAAMNIMQPFGVVKKIIKF